MRTSGKGAGEVCGVSKNDRRQKTGNPYQDNRFNLTTAFKTPQDSLRYLETKIWLL